MRNPTSDATTDADSPVFDLNLLTERVGPVAAREFTQASDTYKANLYTWATETLPNLLDSEFIPACSYAIYDAANVSRFRSNFEHVHFKASAFWAESQRRHNAAHPDEGCVASTLYDRAWNHSVRDAGQSHMAHDARPCTCATPPTDA